MPPARKPKGNKQSPSDELRNILRLNNNLPIFAKLRKNILLIGKEFLDIKKPPGQQNEAIKAVMKELAGRYPDLFDTEDKHRRLKLALSLIRQRHNRMRHSAKRKITRTRKKSRHTSARLSAHLNPSSVKEMKVESEIATPDLPLVGRDESPGYRDFVVPTNFSEPSSSSQPNNQGAINRRPPATPLRRRATPGIISNSSASAPTTRGMVPLTPQSSVSTPAPRTPTARRPVPNASGEGHPLQDSAGAAAQPRRQISSVPPSPGAFRTNERDETDAVYTFLAGCVPSMEHLFEGFVDYGCQNEEFLLGISSWPPELISNLIRKVAVKCGEYVSDMEVDVLQARFLTYFTTR